MTVSITGVTCSKILRNFCDWLDWLEMTLITGFSSESVLRSILKNQKVSSFKKNKELFVSNYCDVWMEVEGAPTI